jgi:SprT-like family
MDEHQQPLTRYREEWLQAATGFLFDLMEQHGLLRVKVRVSCGWPSRGGLAQRRTVIGQCFAPQICADGCPQIFISPRLADGVEVLGTLLHELIHASVGCEHGHGAKFSQSARKVGLTGRPTATTVGDTLRPFLLAYVAQAGEYPHAAIQVQTAAQQTGSRLRLYQCGCHPAVKVRVASDQFQATCDRCGYAFIQVVNKIIGSIPMQPEQLHEWHKNQDLPSHHTELSLTDGRCRQS